RRSVQRRLALVEHQRREAAEARVRLGDGLRGSAGSVHGDVLETVDSDGGGCSARRAVGRRAVDHAETGRAMRGGGRLLFALLVAISVLAAGTYLQQRVGMREAAAAP